MPNSESKPFATAHRGDSTRFRENTLAAIQSAVDKKADIVEIDIRITSDNQVVVLHDPTLERLWGYPCKVSEVPLETVLSLGFGEYRIPTLSDVIDIFRDSSSCLMIDMDSTENALPALRVVDVSGIDTSKFIWCGDLEAMRIIRSSLQEARIWLPWNETGFASEELLTELSPEFVNSHYSYWSREKVKAVHDFGIKTAAWTIDDAPTMRWASAIGIDAITTNNLALLQATSIENDHVDPLDVERATSLAISLGKWAIMVCQWMSPGEILTKVNPADLVTEVDLFIEKHAREMILANFPTHNIVGEEFGGTYEEQTPTWYIDPVDGTTNFANRTPWSSLSLSLAVGREPMVAVTIDPWRNKLFHAIKGAGAFVNGKRIALPDIAPSENPLAGRVVLTELDGSRPWKGMEHFLASLGEAFCTMRIMGAGTLSLTAVSANYGIGAVVDQFSPIDHLAAALIARESGCFVLNEKGEEDLFPLEGGLLIVQPVARDFLAKIWLEATSWNRTTSASTSSM